MMAMYTRRSAITIYYYVFSQAKSTFPGVFSFLGNLFLFLYRFSKDNHTNGNSYRNNITDRHIA
jgi:hypothetical protein